MRACQPMKYTSNTTIIYSSIGIKEKKRNRFFPNRHRWIISGIQLFSFPRNPESVKGKYIFTVKPGERFYWPSNYSLAMFERCLRIESLRTRWNNLVRGKLVRA